MKTRIIHEDQVEQYRASVLSASPSCIEECDIKLALLGIASDEMELEEAKKQANVGDCMLIGYNNMLVPMQVVDKKTLPDGTLDVILQSYYLLEQRAFDQNTNVYKDAEIRRYLNGEFLEKFDPEFVAALKPTEVHTDDYTTIDKCWLLSHEEIGYKDDSNMFKPNIGTRVYDYYKEDAA